MLSFYIHRVYDSRSCENAACVAHSSIERGGRPSDAVKQAKFKAAGVSIRQSRPATGEEW